MNRLAAFGRERLAGFGSKTSGSVLEAELKRATGSDSMQIPEDALLAIAQASHEASDRREVMRHIHGCLNEERFHSQWRRIYGGLCVAEHLLKHGSLELVRETAEGAHFDIMQRLSLLEKYANTDDQRVEALIRRKAVSLHSGWIERQSSLATDPHPCKGGGTQPARPRAAPFASRSSDDTDDDVSDDEASRVPQKRDMAQTLKPGMQDDSTTDGDSSGSSGIGLTPDPSPRAALPMEMDLLGEELSSAPCAPAPGQGDMADLFGDDALLGSLSSPTDMSSFSDDLLGGVTLSGSPSPLATCALDSGDLVSSVAESSSACVLGKGLVDTSDLLGGIKSSSPTPSVDWLQIAEAQGIHKGGLDVRPTSNFGASVGDVDLLAFTMVAEESASPMQLEVACSTSLLEF